MYIYKNNEKMKKMLFVLTLFAVGLSGFGQNVTTKQLANGVDRTTDTSFQIAPAAFINNYTFQIWTYWDTSVITTTPSIVLEVSPDAAHWLRYPNMDSVIVTTTSGNVAFEDYVLPANYMRLRWNLTTNDTIRNIDVWYTLKRP
jgi:hypothetical protein